jgi:hypothetical protein
MPYGSHTYHWLTSHSNLTSTISSDLILYLTFYHSHSVTWFFMWNTKCNNIIIAITVIYIQKNIINIHYIYRHHRKKTRRDWMRMIESEIENEIWAYGRREIRMRRFITLIVWCLMPLLTIFQLYNGCQFY